ncbi:hypothetical protein UFOVP34_87, partial [uncultured Caudovirales phage]
MEFMSKALLRQHAEKAIREREEQEKAITKKIQESSPMIQPQVSSIPPKPMVLTQTIVLPNNNASDIVKAKLKAEQLRLENERIAKEKEALERENAALKLRYELALKEAQEKAVQEQAKQDIEGQLEKEIAVEKNEQLVRKISQKNDLLKEELARLRKGNEEKKASSEVLTQVLDVEETAKAENLVAAPPVYEEEHALVA